MQNRTSINWSKDFNVNPLSIGKRLAFRLKVEDSYYNFKGFAWKPLSLLALICYESWWIVELLGIGNYEVAYYNQLSSMVYTVGKFASEFLIFLIGFIYIPFKNFKYVKATLGSFAIIAFFNMINSLPYWLNDPDASKYLYYSMYISHLIAIIFFVRIIVFKVNKHELIITNIIGSNKKEMADLTLKVMKYQKGSYEISHNLNSVIATLLGLFQLMEMSYNSRKVEDLMKYARMAQEQFQTLKNAIQKTIEDTSFDEYQ